MEVSDICFSGDFQFIRGHLECSFLASVVEVLLMFYGAVFQTVQNSWKD